MAALAQRCRIIARLAAVALMLVLCACSGQEEAVRTATQRAIDSLAAGEALTSIDLYPLLPDERLSSLGRVHEPIEKVCVAALGRMTYELGDVAIDGSSATVQVTVTAPDLFEAFERAQADVEAYALTPEAVAEMAVREDINQQARYLCDWLLVYLADHLGDADLETLTFTAPAYLKQGDGGAWQLDYAENPELMAALFCVG